MHTVLTSIGVLKHVSKKCLSSFSIEIGSTVPSFLALTISMGMFFTKTE